MPNRVWIVFAINQMRRGFHLFLLGSAASLAVVMGAGCSQPRSPQWELLQKWKDRSIYDIETRSLEGSPVPLGQFTGKVVLVVNVASQCGLAGQYTELENLYVQFKDRGLVVIGFPSNDFGGQEPGTAKEIREFCTTRYPVSFPIMEKVHVKAGPDQCAVYEFLGTKTGVLPGWNFGKYLIGRDGQPIAMYASSVKPSDAALHQAIDQALGK